MGLDLDTKLAFGPQPLSQPILTCKRGDLKVIKLVLVFGMAIFYENVYFIR